MFQKLKKKSIVKSLPIVMILCFIGILLIISNLDVQMFSKERVEFETLTPDEIYPGMVVNASIHANYGVIMEEYETHILSAKRTLGLYYAILAGDPDAEDVRFMAIKVPAHHREKMDKMTEDTYNYGYSEPVQYSGVIRSMSYEEHEYFKEFFLDSGIAEDEVKNYISPYYISTGILLYDENAVPGIVFGITAVLAGLCFLIYTLSGGQMKAMKQELKATGLSESNAEYEYEGARVLDEQNEVRIGRRLTFFMSGRTPHVILNQRLIWAYQNTSAPGMHQNLWGTSHQIVLNLYGKKNYHFNPPSGKVAQEILTYIHQTMPWVVIGYNKELASLYQNDYQGFLDICYNKENR